ncbi:hypothetical protein FXF51_49935 [Nonomuraea sp. PA05]|uniref:hypothetical protein n=1 Tax=Nonomuraea sp. PA05 TaxID=2604466 RepID=UPI0011DBAD05|nr:hypothetical protein [Nonomuraea sp. PA05]TYB53209.1 hypothetical protein FXF51_49935 [Nonomuraea sp. PA05]
MVGSHAVADLSTVGLAGIALAVVLIRIRRRGIGLRLLLGALAAAWLVAVGGGMWSFSAALAERLPTAAARQAAADPCSSGAPVRTFGVSLINIPLFLNRFGDVVPEGRMYVLDENVATVRSSFKRAADPFAQRDLVEPLTLRVNKGDCVAVKFTNRLHEPAPDLEFDPGESVFTLPGETLVGTPGAVTTAKRQFAPAKSAREVRFDTSKAPHASMHFDGLTYDVTASDGTAVGNNPASTAAPGASVSYRLFAGVEGEFQFKDGADMSSHQTGAGNFIGSHAFGAFGAIMVEPPGASWVDSSTGQPLKSGTRAVIQIPDGKDFREQVVFMHDEVEAQPGILTRLCRDGEEGEEADDGSCVEPTAAELAKLKAGTLPDLSGGDADALVQGEVPVKLEWFAFNYRAEPGFNREEVGCPAATRAAQGFNAAECIGEETSLSSWPFGDPGGGDLVFPSYRGEPTQFRLIHPAEFETHTFHQHVNRWPFDPKDEGGLDEVSKATHHIAVTNALDVQAVSPGSHYSLIMEGGAGSAHDDKPATFGDIIFHCHLYPHFANGMWGLNRTFDRLEDGTRRNPDTTQIPRLIPLADHPAPPAPTADEPGFPHFIPGKFGFKGPKAPLSVAERKTGAAFPPTAAEIRAADDRGQVPGGFFQDPCPATRSDGKPIPVKTFHVSAIELKQTYNPELNWNNPQSRVYVGGTTSAERDAKVAKIRNGEKPEPFSPLLNVGDCVVYHLRNDLPAEFGGTVFDRRQITNEVGIHQHMVQFDVLSSDGAANGWNYDQGADAAAPNKEYTYRDFVHADTATNSFHDHFFPNVHQDNGLFGGATIHPPGCTFHDPTTEAVVHVGTIVDVRCAPGATDYHGRPADGQDYRNVSLFVEDRVPMFKPADASDPGDDRFVTPEGVPIFPAKFPSGSDDQGVMGINYRLEPFEGRRQSDMANVFDSGVHGNPYTPIPRAFEGDLIKWRLFQLSQEESHGFNLDRFRWKQEPRDPDSPLVQAQHIGMLEYFDVHADMGYEVASPGDTGEYRSYVYNYGGADDWFLGTWGTLIVYNCREGFEPPTGRLAWLPDNMPDTICAGAQPAAPGQSPPRDEAKLPIPGSNNPCPHDEDGTITVPTRRFTIAAINKDITYNKAGDHDPHGAMYALEEDVAAIKAGTKKPEPLVIRANAGDCVEVTLKNQLDPAKMQPHCFEGTEPGQLGFRDPSQGGFALPGCLDQPPGNEHNVPGFKPLPVSSRVGLRPAMVDSHVEGAGSNVGYNFPDSTVGPGQSILYRWYAPEEDGATGLGVLQDYADPLNHGHHGLFGGLVIEPKGSTYKDPRTGADLRSGVDAVIVDPNGKDFREHVILMNSDLSLFRKDTNGNTADDLPVPDNLDLALTPSREADDPEDQGEFAINYSNEPWSHRYAVNQDLAKIFSSTAHGDPATPLFRAYPKDPVRLRVAQVVGDPRSTGFALHGHTWRRAPGDPQSQIAAFQGQFNPGVAYNIHLDPAVTGGAGGPGGIPGDYLYRSGTLARHLTGGQWGIFRVLGAKQPDLVELPDHPFTGSRAQ